MNQIDKYFMNKVVEIQPYFFYYLIFYKNYSIIILVRRKRELKWIKSKSTKSFFTIS